MDTKKPKGWKSFDFGQQITKSINISTDSNRILQKQPTLKTNGCSETVKITKDFNFEVKLAPKQISELAVHPKKLQELQDCLLDILSQKDNIHPHFLLLTGPSGSGKLTALKVICREFGVAIQEWINPMEQDYEITRENQISQFLDFLIGSKWGSLFQNEENQITVVKDFPNTLIRQPEQFRGVLEECWYKTKMPIVFICTDATNNNVNLVKSLFCDDIIRNFRIRQIEFNSCAATLMRNAIKRAQVIIKDHPDLFTPPSSEILEAIVATSMGDIRNAMNQFYLSSLKGGGCVPLVTDKQSVGVKRKQRGKNNNKIKSMERDETLGLFHGLGRVLNPKWNEDSNNRERLNCDFDKLIDEFSTQPTMFMSFLFENYLKYFGDFNDAAKAAEIMSFSIKFLDSYVDRHEILLYGLWVSVLGLMISNRHKVSKWTQIRGPVKIERKVINEVQLLGFDSTDLFYYSLIKNSVESEKNLSKTGDGFDSDEICIEDDD